MKDGMVIKGNWESFLDLDGEDVLLVKRQHVFVLIAPILVNVLLFSIFAIGAFLMFNYLFLSFPLLIITLLLLVSISASLAVYSYIYWFYHLYVLTSKKLLEVKYTPLSSHVINDIFLDKVNCTEIDLSSKGFFHE